LLWRDGNDRTLSPLDALKIYALKTSPAFEAALYSGIRLAGPAKDYEESIRTFSRNLGVAFQILNDLNDWEGDEDNKLIAGGDVLSGRPTLLWALALQALDANDRNTLLSLVDANSNLTATKRLAGVKQLYIKAGVFDTAMQLVDKHQARAEQVADAIEPEALRRLLYFLVDTVLERPNPASPSVVSMGLPITSVRPITAVGLAENSKN
jgi:geranylgeranyl diphosphate synthase, type II